MARRECVVIGAGLGGLATAIRLQNQGWAVTVIEKNKQPGGRCNQLRVDGFTFDTGPTLLLMRDVLDDLFHAVGRRLEDYLELLRVQPNYRIHFGDGSQIEFSSDLDATAAEFEGLERGAGKQLHSYLADAAYKYRVSRERFVERNFLHLRDFATLRNLYYLLTTNTLRKLDHHANRYFRDPRLAAALTFQSMYLGLAPSQAPAVYSLLPYTELMEGIWFPRGGMYRIVEALLRLAGECGVRVVTDTPVRRVIVRDGRARGVELLSGDVLPSTMVVSNADLLYTYDSLLPVEARARRARWRASRLDHGSSACLIFLGLDAAHQQLNHHNVYLSRDITANYRAIFRDRLLPADPSFYVCLPQRTDPNMAPAGRDGLYILIPSPTLSPSVRWDQDLELLKQRVYERLEVEGLTGLRKHITFEQVVTPIDLADAYNLAQGSAFGIAHSFAQVGFMRPANKAAKIRGLYFVGASTQPGGGIPMVIIGSRLTAERIKMDHLDG